MQTIEIVHFYLTSNNIFVGIKNELEEKEVRVHRPSFTSWLFRTGRFAVDYFNGVISNIMDDLRDYLLCERKKDVEADYSGLLDIDNEEN